MKKVIYNYVPATLMFISLALFGTIGYFAIKQQNKINELKEINEQLSGNYTALTDSVRTYKVKADKLTNLNASIAYRASVDANEWIAKNRKDAELIRKMGVKINDLQLVTNVSTITHDTIRVDSIVYRYGASNFTFNSEYMNANVTINHSNPEQSALSYQYRNDLLLTNEFQQKHFLFIKYGKKFKTAHIISKDPNCKIMKFEYKEIIEY